MTDPFWEEVRAVFEAASDVSAEERDAFLRALAADRPEVFRAAGELLAADSDGFLSVPPAFPGDAASAGPPRIAPGAVVHGYRVERLIGRGGMGEVYEGVRASADFDKRVAIKLLSAGDPTPQTVARFERERRILAQLSHPHIATLLDGGVLADGSPFLVMEFVEGERITQWCRARPLSVDERLALFDQVCDAVSYAHRNFIVHRDLKPGNILVTGDAGVKLLDFGIAKVLGDRMEAGLGSAEPVTRPEARALTPEYAAPEQLTDGPITTGTDVYALGLLLYELLTAVRPFASRGLPYRELVRAVTTTTPAPPSEVVRAHADRRSRSSSRLRGDLDAITLHALRADPADRYGTVDELRADLRRFALGRPVSAMRGQRLYRLRKFATRNRGKLAAAGLVAVSLIAGVVATITQAHRADVQRSRAEATTSFLTEMLQSVDPNSQGRHVLMSDVLDSAARRIAREPPSEPEVEASLRSAIGASYLALGEFDQAEPHLRRALAIRQQRPGDVIPLADATTGLARLYDQRGEYARADTFYRRALSLLPAGSDTAVVRRGAELVNQLARMQSQLGHYPAAVALLDQALDRERALYGPMSAIVAGTLSDLGVTLMQAGKIDQADSAERAALAIVGAQPRPSRLLEGTILGRLATGLDLAGDRNGSDSAYRESLAILVPILGPDHPDVTWFTYNYAGSLLEWGEPSAALELARKVLSLRGKTLPDTHPMVASSLVIEGEAFGELGDHAAAERALREALTLRHRYLPPSHWLIGSAESYLGAELFAFHPGPEAIRLLTSGCRTIRAALGSDNPKTKDAIDRLQAAGMADSCR
jgi:eukaryotic-like serine/threonine-protein kinase